MMKNVIIVLLVVALFGVIAYVVKENGGIQGEKEYSGTGVLGSACLTDGDCRSHECKGFECVRRKDPCAPLGQKCWVDGQCCSDECKGFKCVRKGK